MATTEERLAALESAVANAATKSDLEAWKKEVTEAVAAELKAFEERISQRMHGLAAEFSIVEDKISQKTDELVAEVKASEERLNQQMHGLAAEFTIFEDRFNEMFAGLRSEMVAAVSGAKPA